MRLPQGPSLGGSPPHGSARKSAWHGGPSPLTSTSTPPSFAIALSCSTVFIPPKPTRLRSERTGSYEGLRGSAPGRSAGGQSCCPVHDGSVRGCCRVGRVVGDRRRQ